MNLKVGPKFKYISRLLKVAKVSRGAKMLEVALFKVHLRITILKNIYYIRMCLTLKKDHLASSLRFTTLRFAC